MGSSFADVSVLVRQKKGRRRAPVRFRDNPELHASAERVSLQNPPAVLQAESVLPSIVLI